MRLVAVPGCPRTLRPGSTGTWRRRPAVTHVERSPCGPEIVAGTILFVVFGIEVFDAGHPTLPEQLCSALGLIRKLWTAAGSTTQKTPVRCGAAAAELMPRYLATSSSQAVVLGSATEPSIGETIGGATFGLATTATTSPKRWPVHGPVRTGGNVRSPSGAVRPVRSVGVDSRRRPAARGSDRLRRQPAIGARKTAGATATNSRARPAPTARPNGGSPGRDPMPRCEPRG